MAVTESACPYLPIAESRLTWRDLNHWKGNPGSEFYFTALQYGQQLWLEGLTARAILAVDRALYADLEGTEKILSKWPWPYRAIGWLIKHNPTDRFMGNPRVHYQHLADRVRGERAELRKWRAWAAWAIVRRALPELPADTKHDVVEPDDVKIEHALKDIGACGEVGIWLAALDSA